MSSNGNTEEGDNAELLAALDELIEHLPRRYREALLLCRLDGNTYSEAALELGCPIPTIIRRVAYAERLLHKQLILHGIAMSGCALAAVLRQVTEVGPLPAQLSSETICKALAFLHNTLPPSRALWIAQVILQSLESAQRLPRSRRGP
jgi:hypothetical protein